MSIITKRIFSMLYWLAGTPIGLLGTLTGLLVGHFLSGYRAGRGIHEQSIDVFDPKHNENP